MARSSPSAHRTGARSLADQLRRSPGYERSRSTRHFQGPGPDAQVSPGARRQHRRHAEHKLLYDAAGLSRRSAVGYDDLLDTLMITQRVPAWAGNRMDRAVRLPKRYLIDPGLLGPLLRVDQRRVLRDGDLLGRVLDTLAAAQLRAECAVSVVGADLFHHRDSNGRREVDLLIEARDGQLIAVEVKATAAPSAADARHLGWFAGRVGSSFAAGLVLHTGPRVFRLAERIVAVPIASLWSPVTG